MHDRQPAGSPAKQDSADERALLDHGNQAGLAEDGGLVLAWTYVNYADAWPDGCREYDEVGQHGRFFDLAAATEDKIPIRGCIDVM
jgi:hypothetical protein